MGNNYLKSQKLRLFCYYPLQTSCARTTRSPLPLSLCSSLLLTHLLTHSLFLPTLVQWPPPWSAHDKLSGLGTRMFIMWNPFLGKKMYKQQKWLLKKIAPQRWLADLMAKIGQMFNFALYVWSITFSAVSGHPSS